MGGRDPCHRKEAGEAWSASILEVRNHRARGAWRTWSPPPPLTVQSVERGPERDKGLSRTHLSTRRLFIPGQLGGVLPCTLGHCPHSGLAPAVLCLGPWGQPQAAETWRLL